MKIIKPNILKLLLFYVFIYAFIIIEPIVNEYSMHSFNYLAKVIFLFVIVVALNYLILHEHIRRWFSKGHIEINLLYLLISISLLAIFILSPFYGFISDTYYNLTIFMICYFLISSFKK